VIRLAAQPTEEGTPEQGRVEAVRLRSPMLARHRNARRMDDVSLDVLQPQPTGQPEAIAARLEGHRDALDRATGLDRLVPPTMQQAEQPCRIGVQLL
jgi:hypothetical protein